MSGGPKVGTVLVTGCAGFVGSHLCERLLSAGEQVIGIDAFKPNYGRWVKERNLSFLRDHPNFTFLEQDLLNCDLHGLLQGVDVVYHQAALPGVRTSWGHQFVEYVDQNILVTQKLLDAAKDVSLQKIVYASSSSVYGGVTGPVDEEGPTRPISPYGVTKLSAEQLCQLYAYNFGVPVVSLRCFTVFGPRQRPDMAIHRFIYAVLHDVPITVYGNGEQTRDFTFVDDAVDANLTAAATSRWGTVFNIGGGCRASVNELIQLIEQYTGKRAIRQYVPEQPGDPKDTWADVRKARLQLGYTPKFDLEKGVYLQVQDMRLLYRC
jgi:UDP-glucuronate 4-epimerase